MFHHNDHFDVWHSLQISLKRGDDEAVARIWHEALPELARCYDDLRMLYYLGNFGRREPYQRACATMRYLRGEPVDIMRYRLSVFRYAVEKLAAAHSDRKNWMMEDLAAALNMRVEDFPTASNELPMPDSLRKRIDAAVKTHNSKYLPY